MKVPLKSSEQIIIEHSTTLPLYDEMWNNKSYNKLVILSIYLMFLSLFRHLV